MTVQLWLVVSIGRLAALYVVFVPLEYNLTEPPHSTYVIVSSMYFVGDMFDLHRQTSLLSIQIDKYETVNHSMPLFKK